MYNATDATMPGTLVLRPEDASMPACAPVACKTSKVLLENDVISVSSHEVESTTAAEVAPSMAPSLV